MAFSFGSFQVGLHALAEPMWLWAGSTNRVTCFYCNAKLTLVPLVPSAASRAKGKQPATEDGHVAVGTKHDFWCAECAQITRTDQVCT